MRKKDNDVYKKMGLYKSDYNKGLSNMFCGIFKGAF